MSINVSQETLIPLADAARLLPKFGGKRVHTSTLWRWCIEGVRSVRLEHVRVGGRICTSVEALSRFTNELSVTPQTDSSAKEYSPQSEGEKSRLKASDDACAALDSEGFDG